jgi:chemotaxis family two-component system sensor kinase Cph1
MNETTTTPTDHSKCADEAIHTPGAIQPFGVLLAVDPNTLTVRHASENGRDVFGREPVELLGRPSAELIGLAAEAALRDAIDSDGLTHHRPIPISVPGTDARRWHGVAHSLGGIVFIELEPADEKGALPVDTLAAVRLSVGRISATTTVSDFSATTAREVRSLTGYDRVMVYRFDAEWNGEVVADERRADLEPFHGLHYPASDIPAQARALFLANRVRVIPDATYEPVPVVPDRDGRTGLPLDLSRCLSRSAAAVHREYLHNMGVGASLTTSLVVGGRLWGLIACHHATPRTPGPAVRETCDLFTQVASAHLAFLAETEDRNYLVSLAEALGRTGTRAGTTTPPIAALAKDPADMLALVGGHGAVVWRSGRVVAVGRTPPAEALGGLIGWIKQVGAPLVATDRLGHVYGPAEAFADVASGLLALEVSRAADEYLLWFRPQVLQAVNWAGDPHGTSEANGRLSPRRSFAVWKETVRGRSLPWRPAEVENARRVKELLLTAAAQSAVRLEALLPICAWCKKIRDEPGYWRGVEDFIRDLVDVRFTHGICPACLDQQSAEFAGDGAAGVSSSERRIG